ncbi:lipase 1-like [Plodia interpunctella]|uniref:lipase 1-like n=1 Tax=Plodia interpunctella TaxID=58824 RepID=UPI0023685572|nr:lipase 1-like [Plodia interpunctella]
MLYKTLITILIFTPVILSHIKHAPRDGKLTFTGLALKYGKVAEEYDVTTKDGYILKIYRIPGDKTKPLLLMHGILTTSDDFIIRGNDSLAVTLSNAGYDVWLGNYRGNRYSRRHITMDPDKNATFWKFGPHEHGYYDLATTIDLVLNNTGEDRLSLIGYSEGTMITYVLGAERPEYNDKIKVFIALAPICHINKMIEALPFVAKLGYDMIRFLKLFKIEELFGFDSLSGIMTRNMCSQSVGLQMCRRILLLVSGYDPDGLVKEFMPLLFEHYPAGTSMTNVEHFMQILTSKRFAKFDYGPVKNFEKYGSKIAPDYNLNKITMNIYLIAGRNDRLSVLADSRLQAKELPNVKEYFVIEKKFNHIDFLWSRQSRQVLYPKVLDILDKYR